MGESYQGDRASAVTGSVTGVLPVTESRTILKRNPFRNGAYFFNASGFSCYLKFGEGATTGSFTIRLKDSSYYELPPTPIYWGPVSVCWGSDASGSLGLFTVTETE